MDSSKAGTYLDGLPAVKRDRYIRKLKCLYGGPGVEEYKDPYEINEELWVDDVSKWPCVEFPALYMYFIETPGGYTREKLKAYKSLEAYNYYSSGWVRTVYFYALEDKKHCFLKGQVNCSQRLTEKPHHPWVAVEIATGTIVTGHCTCMAGLGEMCSHVAALLFKVEACIRLGVASMTPTSLPCAWNQAFSKKVQPAPVSKIKFDRPRRKQSSNARIQYNSTASAFSLESLTSAPTISQDLLLQSLHKAYPFAAIFTVVPGFSKNPCVSSEVEQKVPNLLTTLYDLKYKKMKEDELASAVKGIQLNVTEEEALFLEKATKSQSRTCLWYDHRIGRITASMFGRVYKCAETKYPTALVKSIMQYSHVNPAIPSLKWGRDNEDHARENYRTSMESNHESFCVQSAGLLVSTKFPFLGASPDGITSCSCCGAGLLEIVSLQIQKFRNLIDH